MKKILILITLLAFNLKLNTMQVSSSISTTSINIDNLPQEVKLHIFSFIKVDALIELFKEIARIAGTNTEMRNLAHDPVLIKNLIYKHFQEQLKTKSLENIAPDIGQAMEFIYNQFRKNNTTLLQAIDTAFKSAIQDLSIKYLNSIGIDTKNLNQELWEAVQSHSLNKTILLLAANADPNFQDYFGYTVLMKASVYGHIHIVKALLSAKANPNIKNYYNEDTALILASSNGYIDIVKALLSANADPNIKNNCGYTALITASEMGRFDIVKVILSNIKTNPNIQNNDGKTALSIAEKKGLNDIANFIRNYASSYSNI